MAPAVFVTLMLAQGPPAEGADAARIERIRKALTEAPAITVAPKTDAEGLVFKVTVLGGKSDKPLWDDWSPVPTYIRPWFRGDHHEFLEQVTKEEFRSATLYPVGIPVVPIIELLVKHIKAANRKKGETNAREEVRRALEELLACRANPDKPGC